MNYCIYGTEGLLIKKKLDEIKKEWLKDDCFNLNFYDYSKNDFNLSKIIEDCWTIPFLSEYKMIVIRNASFLSNASSLNEAEQNMLMDYLKKSCPSTILVLVGEFEKMDSRKKLTKELNKSAKVYLCNPLDEAQFKAYVKDCLKKHSLKLSQEALDELLSRLKPNMLAFENILEQLCLYPDEIDSEVIKALVHRPLEDNVFDLTDALVKQNLKRCLHIWRDLQVVNTDPIGLVGLISAQFRLLYQVKVLAYQGNSEAAIASSLKVHPYRVKLAKEASSRISSKRLDELVKACAELDQQLKSGTLDRNIGFENFLIFLCKG